MRYRRLAGSVYSASLGAQVIAGFGALVVTGLQRADPVKLGKTLAAVPFLLKPINWILDEGWWLLPFLVILSGALGFIRKTTGPPWLWNAIHSYLDEFRGQVFAVGAEDALHHHRVTLFKHVRFKFTSRGPWWGGWLVPVERSGFATRKKVSFFRAPDNPDQAEGIAGMAWAREEGRVVKVKGLPDVSSSPSLQDLASYAKATGVPEKWLRERKPQARSFCGIPVNVAGRRWGVLVLDSRSPDGVKDDSDSLYRPFSKYVGELLRRV